MTDAKVLSLKKLESLRRIPSILSFFRTLRLLYFLRKTGSFRFIHLAPPGHYYSPIPNFNEISARSQVLFERDDDIHGIHLNEEAQLKLLETFSHYYNDLPFSETPSETTRYYYDNYVFRYADAIVLYCFLRHFEPRRVIEIGSGFSSAAILDSNDLFLENKIDLTFIEPYPERLFRLLTPEDKRKHTFLQKNVQDVPLEVFRALSANDVLFVDSSHVVKVGSDVNHILLNILPVLRPGVLIHFHDVFWPFEYPKEWILEQGWAWNEAYFLRSFLQFNNTFEIMYFNSFMAKRHPDILREKMPLHLRDFGGQSIWLKKVS